MPLYLSALQAGGINARAQPRWLREHPGGGLLDADGALGQVAMRAGVDFSARHIGATPTVTVVIQDSTHYGAGSYWSQTLTDLGCVALITSTTGPVTTPYGGQEKILGSNPLTLALPVADGDYLAADLATSAGAYGKVVEADNRGEQLPSGWAVDEAGEPTTDPAAALRGALVPFGGHKGSALMVAMEGLSAALGSANYAYETEDIWVNPASRMNMGHTIIAINPAFFGGTAHTQDRVAQLRQEVRASGAAGPVLAPGDVEMASAAVNTVSIPLLASSLEEINALAGKRHTPVLRPDSRR